MRPDSLTGFKLVIDALMNLDSGLINKASLSSSIRFPLAPPNLLAVINTWLVSDVRRQELLFKHYYAAVSSTKGRSDVSSDSHMPSVSGGFTGTPHRSRELSGSRCQSTSVVPTVLQSFTV